MTPLSLASASRLIREPSGRGKHFMESKRQGKDIYQEARHLIRQKQPTVPKVVVVDLDYTIWPYWCDMYTTKDISIAQLFPETLEILEAVRDSGIKLAVASRSPTPDVAKTFLKQIGILKGFFEMMVIVPYVNKDREHFPRIRKQLGVEYHDMMFFDDEQLQHRVVGQLGVTSILVSTSSGLCLQSFQKGLQKFVATRQQM